MTPFVKILVFMGVSNVMNPPISPSYVGPVQWRLVLELKPGG